MSEKNSFRVRLMRWGDSSSSGRTVTLKLPDDTEDHPFKGLDVGSRNGQLMEMEITLLEGDAELRTLGPKPSKRSTPSSSLPTKNVPEALSPSNKVVGSHNPQLSAPTQSVEDPIASPSSELNQHQPFASDTLTETANASSHGSETATDELDTYASQMSSAAESLAAVAEEMSKATEDSQEAEGQQESGPPPLTRGQQAVVRAIDLCKSIDQQRAGFFYFMMSRYPSVPNLENEPGNWSRDAKVTRDRVCHHCELDGLKRLEDDTEAREKFEALENEFERHERLR